MDSSSMSVTVKPRPIIKKRKYSRGGCNECKRRKMKCDETKPHCHNCTRLKKSCLYPEKSNIRFKGEHEDGDPQAPQGDPSAQGSGQPQRSPHQSPPVQSIPSPYQHQPLYPSIPQTQSQFQQHSPSQFAGYAPPVPPNPSSLYYNLPPVQHQQQHQQHQQQQHQQQQQHHQYNPYNAPPSSGSTQPGHHRAYPQPTNPSYLNPGPVSRSSPGLHAAEEPKPEAGAVSFYNSSSGAHVNGTAGPTGLGGGFGVPATPGAAAAAASGAAAGGAPSASAAGAPSSSNSLTNLVNAANAASSAQSAFLPPGSATGAPIPTAAAAQPAVAAADAAPTSGASGRSASTASSNNNRTPFRNSISDILTPTDNNINDIKSPLASETSAKGGDTADISPGAGGAGVATGSANVLSADDEVFRDMRLVFDEATTFVHDLNDLVSLDFHDPQNLSGLHNGNAIRLGNEGASGGMGRHGAFDAPHERSSHISGGDSGIPTTSDTYETHNFHLDEFTDHIVNQMPAFEAEDYLSPSLNQHQEPNVLGYMSSGHSFHPAHPHHPSNRPAAAAHRSHYQLNNSTSAAAAGAAAATAAGAAHDGQSRTSSSSGTGTGRIRVKRQEFDVSNSDLIEQTIIQNNLTGPHVAYLNILTNTDLSYHLYPFASSVESNEVVHLLLEYSINCPYLLTSLLAISATFQHNQTGKSVHDSSRQKYLTACLKLLSKEFNSSGGTKNNYKLAHDIERLLLTVLVLTTNFTATILDTKRGDDILNSWKTHLRGAKDLLIRYSAVKQLVRGNMSSVSPGLALAKIWFFAIESLAGLMSPMGGTLSKKKEGNAAVVTTGAPAAAPAAAITDSTGEGPEASDSNGLGNTDGLADAVGSEEDKPDVDEDEDEDDGDDGDSDSASVRSSSSSSSSSSGTADESPAVLAEDVDSRDIERDVKYKIFADTGYFSYDKNPQYHDSLVQLGLLTASDNIEEQAEFNLFTGFTIDVVYLNQEFIKSLDLIRSQPKSFRCGINRTSKLLSLIHRAKAVKLIPGVSLTTFAIPESSRGHPEYTQLNKMDFPKTAYAVLKLPGSDVATYYSWFDLSQQIRVDGVYLRILSSPHFFGLPKNHPMIQELVKRIMRSAFFVRRKPRAESRKRRLLESAEESSTAADATSTTTTTAAAAAAAAAPNPSGSQADADAAAASQAGPTEELGPCVATSEHYYLPAVTFDIRCVMIQAAFRTCIQFVKTDLEFEKIEIYFDGLVKIGNGSALQSLQMVRQRRERLRLRKQKEKEDGIIIDESSYEEEGEREVIAFG